MPEAVPHLVEEARAVLAPLGKELAVMAIILRKYGVRRQDFHLRATLAEMADPVREDERRYAEAVDRVQEALYSEELMLGTHLAIEEALNTFFFGK